MSTNQLIPGGEMKFFIALLFISVSSMAMADHFNQFICKGVTDIPFFGKKPITQTFSFGRPFKHNPFSSPVDIEGKVVDTEGFENPEDFEIHIIVRQHTRFSNDKPTWKAVTVYPYDSLKFKHKFTVMMKSQGKLQPVNGAFNCRQK